MTGSQVSQSVRASITQDGAVLIDVDQGKIFSLNVTGSVVWAQLAQGCDPDEIADAISKEYGVDRERARADIEELIGTLEKKRLITR
jgi:hypothetical protein